MSSLVFLLVRTLKNTILEVFRKPAKLVLWILVLAGIGAILIVGSLTGQETSERLDLVWLKGVLFLLILLFTVLAIKKGLSNGDVIFDMNDVNLLFVSPVNPRTILVYGIIRMAKMAFAAGFFILFQGNSLRMFGAGLGALMLLLIGFILAVSLLQIISLLIYVLTNGRPARKWAARLIAIAAFLPLAASFVIQLVSSGNPNSAIEQTLRSSVFALTPVSGWAAEGTIALIRGDIGSGVLFLDRKSVV